MADRSPTLPPVDSYIDGGIVSGFPVTCTAGRLAILEEIGVCGFDGESDPTLEDILNAFFVMSEDNLTAAVEIARNEAVREKVLRKWRDGFTFRKIKVASEFTAWFQQMMECLPDADGGSGSSADKRTWLDRYVDAFASEYGWSRHHILWELPLATGIRLHERIGCRVGASSGVGDISQDAMDILEEAEQDKANG